MRKVPTQARCARSPSPKVRSAIEVVLTPIRRVVSSITDLVSEGDATDYILEPQLEEITAALACNSPALSAYLKRIGKSMDLLGSTLRRAWLEGEVP